MRAQYVVQVADCAGMFSETSCTDFEHALTVLVLMKRAYPDKFVGLINLDRVDMGWADGLTDFEREAADCVVAELADYDRPDDAMAYDRMVDK